jgi:hypothetical protein
MTSRTLYRLSGVALLIGGMLAAIGYIIGSFISGHDSSAITSPVTLASLLIVFFGSLLILLGLPGMYVRQAGRAGILGLLGFLFLSYVFLFDQVVQSFINATIAPELAAHPATLVFALSYPPAMGPFLLAGMLTQILGPLLFGIAILRAGVFPRWTAWVLLATLPLGLVGFLPFLPDALSNLAAIVGNLALAGFGYALLALQRNELALAVPTVTEAQVRA